MTIDIQFTVTRSHNDLYSTGSSSLPAHISHT